MKKVEIRLDEKLSKSSRAFSFYPIKKKDAYWLSEEFSSIFTRGVLTLKTLFLPNTIPRDTVISKFKNHTFKVYM